MDDCITSSSSVRCAILAYVSRLLNTLLQNSLRCFAKDSSLYRRVCIVYYTFIMNTAFGKYIRERREALAATRPGFSVRKVGQALGIQPTYISKIERGECGPPSEQTIIKLAELLGEDPDVLLALAGKVSAELRDIIMKRPKLFADLLKQLKEAPDHAILRIVRDVRDGNW